MRSRERAGELRVLVGMIVVGEANDGFRKVSQAPGPDCTRVQSICVYTMVRHVSVTPTLFVMRGIRILRVWILCLWITIVGTARCYIIYSHA